VPAGNYSLTAKAIATKKNKPDQTALSVTVNVIVNATAALLHFIHVDHLNTPRLVADATGTTVWRWDQQEPFGNSVPDENPSGFGVFDLPLRLPGQYFDKETNLHYNYFRDYDSSVGRYVESDPIGLRAGLNTYAHTRSAPLSAADFFGLETLTCIKPLNLLGGFSSGTSKSFDGYIPNVVNPLYHQYLCVGKDGEFRCGGQDTTGGPVATGAPSQDFYPYNRPDLCVKVDDNKCVENCVYRRMGDPQRPSYILFFSDCQRWVQKVLRDCREECERSK
jgi:RHS repeat-associated protein